jgi:hypothetical protein
VTDERRPVPAVPERMAHLPRDRYGRPVPWFVHWENGEPEFRVAKRLGPERAVALGRCWVCGLPRLPNEPDAFVVGPMCVVNRNSAEPPSHQECALYSVRACPFLTRPQMVRRENGLPPTTDPAGMMILRNPGVAAVYTSRTWHPVRVDNGLLFDVGEPVAVSWWKAGRSATGAEVRSAIDLGLPVLRAEAEPEGIRALRLLDWQVRRAMGVVPA